MFSDVLILFNLIPTGYLGWERLYRERKHGILVLMEEKRGFVMPVGKDFLRYVENIPFVLSICL